MNQTALCLVVCALALAFGVSARPPQALSPSLASVVETERAFAKMSVERGRRAAFLAFFDDDALFFKPEPVRARPHIAAWPENGPFALDWEPRFADVAAAGDLAYTTGPFVRTSMEAAGQAVPRREKQVLGTGWYFTVWKKVGAAWKVAVDTGILSPGSADIRSAPFHTRSADGPVERRQQVDSLSTADRALCERMASTEFVDALGSVAVDDAIVFRDGVAPIIGRPAIASYFASGPNGMTCQPVKDATSRSADLGYTYGKYSIEAPSRQSGYYLRVWKQRAGEWRLVTDLLVPGA